MPTLSSRRIQAFFRRGDAANTSDARGKALEDLLIYVMQRVPGVRFEDRDVVGANGSEEIDLVFWNDRLPTGLPFLPHVLLFECKNWAVPVGSASVNFFASKLQTRHLEFGFLIAANGITGNAADQTAAHQHVHNALLVHRCHLLVFDRAELTALTHTDDLVRLVQRKISLLVLRAG